MEIIDPGESRELGSAGPAARSKCNNIILSYLTDAMMIAFTKGCWSDLLAGSVHRKTALVDIYCCMPQILGSSRVKISMRRDRRNYADDDFK